MHSKCLRSQTRQCSHHATRLERMSVRTKWCLLRNQPLRAIYQGLSVTACHSMRATGMSAFSELPSEVLSLIFRRLSLHEKLLCQSVCRFWSQLLRNQHTQLVSSAIWNAELRLRIRGPLTVRQKITFQYHGPGLPQIQLCPAEKGYTSTESAFIRWFTRMSSVFATINVELSRSGVHVTEKQVALPTFEGGWMFSDLLGALCTARQSTPSGPELHLATGTEHHQ